MKENKVIKFLIPLVAVVVVFESVLLVSNLEKSNNSVENTDATESAQIIEEKMEPVVDFVFSTDTKEMKVGKSYKITLNLSPKEDKMIDGVETYVKYDVDAMKVTNLTPNSELVKPQLSEIDDSQGIIKNIFLIDEKEGLSIKKSELLPLFTFTLTPKKEGSYSIKLNGGGDNQDYATLIVENTTSKSLGWVGNELMINVTK